MHATNLKLSTSYWYHGSPFRFNSIDEFDNNIIFLTDSKSVAKQYANNTILGAQQYSSDINPTIYTISINIDPKKIFDTRKPEHLDIFFQISKQSRETEEDSDDWITKSDLMRVPSAPGSSIQGIFPSYGIAKYLSEILPPLGFDAAFIAEGVQGASLVSFFPQQDLEIVNYDSVSDNTRPQEKLLTEAASREYFNNRRRRRRQKYINLLGGKCERCGATENLHFDHKNPKEKEFRISKKLDAPKDVLMAEVKKCRLLCNKCHRQKTKENGEHGQPRARHGTIWFYKKYKCRCDKCRKAMSDYNRAKRMEKLTELAAFSIAKYGEAGISVFTFIPKSAIESVKKFGLLSGSKLLENPQALKAAFPQNWEGKANDIKENLNDPEWSEVQSGISAFFTLPDWNKLPKKHFIFSKNLVPIKINLEQLIQENPSIKLLGVELTPELIDEREKEISIDEIKSLQDQGPEQLWKHYQGDPEKYAPDVPHLVILTNQISTEYLEI